MANFTPLSAAIGGALIGLAAVLLMLSTGRIAGISGIFGGCLDVGTRDKGWRLAFIAGLILAPLTAGLAGVPVPVPEMPASWVVIVAAGPAGRLRQQARRRLHLRPRRLRHRPAVAALDRRDRRSSWASRSWWSRSPVTCSEAEPCWPSRR